MIKLRLARFFYTFAIRYWSIWSRVYRFFWHRKYSKVELFKNLTPSEANEVVNTLRWTADGPWALWDACGSPHWVQHAINEVAASKEQPTGYLDCDDFSIWCAHAIDKRYYPVIFTFSWLSNDNKLNGHAMCLVRQKDGRMCHVGNWGIFGPYANLRQACEAILNIHGCKDAVGWAILDPSMTVLDSGRALPREGVT